MGGYTSTTTIPATWTGDARSNTGTASAPCCHAAGTAARLPQNCKRRQSSTLRVTMGGYTSNHNIPRHLDKRCQFQHWNSKCCLRPCSRYRSTSPTVAEGTRARIVTADLPQAASIQDRPQQVWPLGHDAPEFPQQVAVSAMHVLPHAISPIWTTTHAPTTHASAARGAAAIAGAATTAGGATTPAISRKTRTARAS